jgi:hypothetical protein
MANWTSSAENLLEQYLQQAQASATLAGADASEVVEDLRRHVQEEIANQRLAIVNEEDMQRILARLGTVKSEATSSVPASAAPVVDKPLRRKKYPFMFMFGSILPLITLVFEVVTRGCAALIFDPIPNWRFLVLVALVPIINGLTWFHLIRDQAVAGEKTAKWLFAGNGLVLGVTLFYALIFLPVTPFAAIGIIYLGIGFLPLSPLLAFVATLLATKRLREQNELHSGALRKPRVLGMAVAAGALALALLPSILTHRLAHQALGEDAEAARTSMRWLRFLGSENTLLRDCYGLGRRTEFAPLNLFMDDTTLTAEDARRLYFRVTGQPFNSVTPPQQKYMTRAWDFLDEMEWDQERGGNAVAGCMKGLTLNQSRMDAIADADAAWSYVEWTLEFKNAFPRAREARAQIALPPGGVVSRLTLWVDGEEREAAFAGTSQVREAYRKVVVVDRRDPVLVTSSGPDRVMMQCFPVPRDGGTIKVRLGITAPLRLNTLAQAQLQWPHFLERNFAIPSNTQHAVWLECNTQPSGTTLAVTRTATGGFSLHGDLQDQALGAPASIISLGRDATQNEFWVSDSQSENSVVTQIVEPRPITIPRRLALVVDGSKPMREWLPVLASVFGKSAITYPLAVFVAHDEVEESPDLKPGDLAKRIHDLKPAGGQDNVPALMRAWDWAAQEPGGVVLWVHGPQPVLLGMEEKLQQRLDRQAGQNIRLLDLQTVAGPNRVAEKFNGASCYQVVPRWDSLEGDLGRLLAGWSKPTTQLMAMRSRNRVSPAERQGRQNAKHLARLWAFEEVSRLVASRKQEEAIRLAATYQLVTPVSGAVVLETKKQFDEAGLKPVSPNTVPTVPEPGVGVLLLVTCVGLLIFRRIKALRVGT